MGDNSDIGTPDHVHAVLGIDDLVDVDDRSPVAPAEFPAGSEVQGLDALLAAYLIDLAPAPAPASITAATLLRVLIIDADAASRRALREMLEVVGYDVITAPSAVSATDLLAQQTIHLVLADDAAGSGSAFRTALHLTRPELPIIVVTKPVHGLLLLDALRGALQPTTTRS